MVSSTLSFPTSASHILKGSALGEGIDWMIRNRPCISATSVSRIFPSGAFNFNCTIFSYSWSAPSSSFIFLLRSLQYLLGFLLSVKTFTASMMLKYHSSFSLFQIERIRFPSNNFTSLPMIHYPPV